MTAADWTAGVIVTGALWAYALIRMRSASRRARDRRELRRSAEAAYRGPHEAA